MTVKAKSGMTANRVVSILHWEKPAFLEGLSQTEVQMIVGKASIRRYAANAAITNETESANHLFLLLEGVARGYALTSRREKIGLGWFPAGKIIGWSALVPKHREYIVSFEAARRSSLLAWDRATIQTLTVAYPRLMENALGLAYDYVFRYRCLHIASLCDPAPQRLARVLEELARGMGRKLPYGFELYISNKELANEAHVTTFTVSRLMREWRRQGLVSKGRGSVVVLQPDALLRIET